MPNFNYILNQVASDGFGNYKTIESPERNLIEDYTLNSLFSQESNTVELYVTSFDNDLLFYDPNYKRYKQLRYSEGAGREGVTSVDLNPIDDAIYYGFENGDIRLSYRFVNDLFSNSSAKTNFYIESISSDRLEVRALTSNLTVTQIREYVLNLQSRLNDSSYFSEFKLNFGNNNTFIGVNVGIEEVENNQAVVLKLYRPLPSFFSKFTTFTVEEDISDPVTFEITVSLDEEKVELPTLKGPNFNVETVEDQNNVTEYLNYKELFSYPVTSSYYELYSLFNEKGAQIAIDHRDFNQFIHFSSAVERLENFKYKVGLIEDYQENLELVNSMSYSGSGITGSREYYEGLVTGIVNNFDHYEKFLYYESGSYSWPKVNTTRPYINDTVDNSTIWYNNVYTSASNYDLSNFDLLTNTVPTFIREDENNTPFISFIHMIAQHFDNLWIYFKAVSDKYDADNRLNFGISKDLVRDAIESLGLKLYNSNQTLDDLFSIYTGKNYDSGSEQIVSHSIATSGSSLEYLQPVPANDYQKEIYKRIYHNVPFLLKNKGTERGIRALINCYGIPDDILSIKTLGGTRRNDTYYLSPQLEVTSSLGKIRLENTGSVVTGSVLSREASVLEYIDNYSDDLHTVEIGFNMSELTDKYVIGQLSGSFNIDNYIGDPRAASSLEYSSLKKLERELTSRLISGSNSLYYDRDPKAFIRLVKFFDNSIFRTVKNFIPARSNLASGIIVKPNILNRSKAKQVQLTVSEEHYSGSLFVESITGSHAGAYGTSNVFQDTTAYTSSIITSQGTLFKVVDDESPMFTGELSGSTVEVTSGNLNVRSKQLHPLVFDLHFINKNETIPQKLGLELINSFTSDSISIIPIHSPGVDGERKITLQLYNLDNTNNIPDYETGSIVGHQEPFNFNVNYNRYRKIRLESTTGTLVKFEYWATSSVYDTGSYSNALPLPGGSYTSPTVEHIPYEIIEQTDGKIYAIYTDTQQLPD